MGRTYTDILLHTVFSTKHRKPLLTERSQCERIYNYMCGVLNHKGCNALEINGWTDHVHILHLLKPSISVSKLVGDLKSSTTIWIKETFGELRGFAWQSGFSSFSVSRCNRTDAANYIRNQQIHHSRCDFKDEIRTLYSRHGVKIDERYVWD